MILGAEPSITTMQPPAPPPIEPPVPMSAAQAVAVAEAKAAAAASYVADLLKKNEQNARLFALGLSALASAFGIYRALTPRCPPCGAPR